MAQRTGNSIRSKFYRYRVHALLIGSFLPYVAPRPIRPEQIILYPILLLYFVHIIAFKKGFLIENISKKIILLFSLFCMWSITSSINSEGVVHTIDLLSNGESYIQSICILLYVNLSLRRYTVEELANLFTQIKYVIVYAAMLNSAVAIFHIYFGKPDFIEYFLPLRDHVRGTNVWDRATEMGRYIGVMSTPLQAGVLYGFAMLSLTFLLYNNKIKKVYYTLFSAIIVIGGLVSTSKAFLVSIGLVLLYHAYNYKTRKGMQSILIFTFVIFTILSTLMSFGVDWDGFYILQKYLQVDNSNAIQIYSAGRYGSLEQGVFLKIRDVVEYNILFGYGLHYKTIVDNAFLEPLVLGGLPGLMLLITIYYFLFNFSFNNYLSSGYSTYCKLLIIYIIIVSFGSPILTKNIVQMLLWVQVGIILIISKSNQTLSIRNKDNGSKL